MFHAENRHAIELVEIKSSLELQVLVYYQGLYSTLYWAVSGGCLLNKTYNYQYGNAILELLTVPIFLLWSLTEVARIFLGYVGNVKEKVPMVSAFLLLTIFPQCVAVAFLTFLQDPKFPFDAAGGAIMLFFLLLELIVGRRALDILITRQTAQFFRLCQEAERAQIAALLEEEEKTPPPVEPEDNAPPKRSLSETRSSLAASAGLDIRRRLNARLVSRNEAASAEEREHLLQPTSPSSS